MILEEADEIEQIGPSKISRNFFKNPERTDQSI